MRTFFKATRPDGYSFHASPNGERPRYLPGDVVRVPHDRRNPKLCTPGVIHASDAEGETLLGGEWPCRLFEVEGEPVVGPEQHKFGFFELRSVREIEAWRALGPNGQEVAAFIERLKGLNDAARAAEWDAAWAAARVAVRDAARDAARVAAWDAAWVAAWAAAWAAARDAARDAAWVAARVAAWVAAWDAALALCSRDLITPEQFTALYAPWEPHIPADSLGDWKTLK